MSQQHIDAGSAGGQIGGRVRSRAKKKAARKNGALGGRPPVPEAQLSMSPSAIYHRERRARIAAKKASRIKTK